MANNFSKTKMATLFEEIAETTSINFTLSKDLDMYNMEEEAEMGRTADVNDTANSVGQQDVEWIPQEYRFNVQDGIVSSDADFQDLIDRNIPVYRTKSKRILSRIGTKDLRDPMRREKKARGMARDIANAVDLECYNTMYTQASLIQRSTSNFDFQSAINAETLMLNRGLGGYEKKLFLSNTDYSQVAQTLGQASRETFTGEAISRARIPDLATFDTMRSDYLLNLTGTTTANITVNGNQSHTVATTLASGLYQDNRYMTLNVNTGTGANFPVNTKFTIAGVNALHPETREDTGELQTFTVVNHDTDGAPVIAPSIVSASTSPYRNCSAQAADAAAITILNTATSAPSLFYTPESTVIIPGRLPVPADAGGVESVEATTENGLPMRMTYWYDPHNEVFNCKTLIYFDVQVIYPWMLGMILSNQT